MLPERRFTMIISAWWRQTNSKFSGQEFEEIHRNIGRLETPNQVRISPSTKHLMQRKYVRIVQRLAFDAVR